jgi:hypothetical protein
LSGFTREPSEAETIAQLRRIVAEEDRGVIRGYLPPGHNRRVLAIIDNLTARLAAPAPRPKRRRKA